MASNASSALVAAGGVISLLLRSLETALAACILVLWATPTLAVAAALGKSISRQSSKQHQAEPESLPLESENPESIPAAGSSADTSNRERKRRSRNWIRTLETPTDEDEGLPSS